MKIDRDNYEIYFLDYLEGRLTAEETAGLLLFVDENPDLKSFIEGEDSIGLVPDKAITFIPKYALKRESREKDESGTVADTSLIAKTAISTPEINSVNCEEYMIRFHENGLDDIERAALANFLIDHPTFISEFEIFESTLLKPDTGIVYTHKSRLKKNIIERSGAKRALAIISVAATVLLFSTLFLKYVHQPSERVIEKQLAQTTNSGTEPKAAISTQSSTAVMKADEINRPNNAEQSIKHPNRKTNTNLKTPNEVAAIESVSKPGNATTQERTTYEVPVSLSIRPATLLATKRMSAPLPIERRKDFDGVSTTAYYDPDALDQSNRGRVLGGRLGRTLAQGIAQTAGTLAREPEVGRFLRGKISLSDIAGLGLAGFNIITDHKLSISRDYDSDGYQIGYSLKDGDRRLTRLP